MNFLAHFYLSGEDDDLALGNYLGDFLTAKEKADLPVTVQKGIELHHEIDRYTDSHPAFKESVSKLRPKFRKYAPVIVDIYYDHFLALDWEVHHHEELSVYANTKYQLLKRQHQLLSPKAQRFFQYMHKSNILLNYRNTQDLQRVFFGMSRRARFESGMEQAVDFLGDHYHDFKGEFVAFFPDIKTHISEYLGDHKK